MPTTAFNVTDKEVRPIAAWTDWTLKGTIYDPDQVVKNVAAYKFKAHVKAGAGGRILKTYSHSSGGITLGSGTYGKMSIAIDASDVPPIARGVLEIVEYSGGSYTGDPTDRWRLAFTAE